MADTPPKPWEQMTGEPRLWYERFKSWLLQGFERSALALYRQELTTGAIGREKARKGMTGHDVMPRKPPRTIPSAWRRAKQRYRWLERAEAWDAEFFEAVDKAWEEKREREIAQYVENCMAPRRRGRSSRPNEGREA